MRPPMEQLRPPTAVDMRPPTWASTGRKSTDSSSSAASNATTVIIVVNVLPLAFERKADDSGWDVTWSSTATGMFYRNLLSDVDAQYAPLYIGCPEVFVARDEELAVEKQLRAFHCVPVYLDPVVGHRYFQGFCKGVLWPVFHNVVDVYNSAQLALDDVPREETHASRGVHRRNSNSTRADKKPQAWCDPASWNPGAQDKCWGDYCSVNRTFSRRVIESYHTGNIIWIQDFHFLMLPSYLLRKLRTALIAVYLHVPFPSSEVFRCLAMRTEILRAMLCADHLGFLVFEHARHFLTSCKRLLGLNYRTSHNGMLVLEYNGRKICISCSHVEPDVSHIYSMVSRLETDSGSLAFRDEIEQCLYSQNNERKFVFASVDRLEGLCALPLKLRAFDRFLATHPAKRKSVVLIQIGLSLDCRPNDYNQTREYVLKFVEEINARWAPPGESVVVFKERRRTSCMERLHLWRICDAYMDTCVRSGLSLLPFEYIIAQERVHETPTTSDSSRHFGAMIVSEFASYSRILNGSLLVNPWRTDDIVNALVKATEMNYYEKHSRYALNHSFLESKSEKKWAERMLSDFEASVTKKQQSEAGETVAVGFGFDYRVMQFESGFVHLDVDEVVKACSKSSRRLFMFDYGGTLSRTANILEEEVGVAPRMHRNGSVESSMECADLGDCHSHLAYDEVIRFIDGKVRTPLSTETRDNICTLCNDPQNVVFILSTGQRAELDAAFADVPNLNLVADSGFFFKKARSSKWECLYADGELDFDWMDEAKLIIQAYASRTNGAYLVVSEVSLLYDYRNSDPEYGEIQALELYEQLRQMAKPGQATVIRAKGFVEIHQFGANKSVAVGLILDYLKEHIGVPDFAFYAGDDESDELAFKALQSFATQEPSLTHVVTCTIGKKPSAARFFVDGISDVLATIHALAVRLRLDSARGLPFCRQSYQDRYLEQSYLVNPAYIHALLQEALGVDKSEPEAAFSAPNEAISVAIAPEKAVWDWYSVGAACAVGCCAMALLTGNRHQLVSQLQRRLFPKLN